MYAAVSNFFFNLKRFKLWNHNSGTVTDQECVKGDLKKKIAWIMSVKFWAVMLNPKSEICVHVGKVYDWTLKNIQTNPSSFLDQRSES